MPSTNNLGIKINELSSDDWTTNIEFEGGRISVEGNH